MAQHEYFDSGVDVSWNWPLTVAVPQSIKYLKETLLKKKYAQKFVRLKLIEAGRALGKYNMLFLAGLPDPAAMLSLQGISTDIVIVLDNPDYDQGNDVPEYRFLAKALKTAGIFHIGQPPSSLGEWFDTLIVNLSHNQNIIEAIESCSPDARLFYDRKLEEQTTLAYFTQTLIAKLRSPNLAKRVFNANTRFLGDIKDLTGAELAQLLESNQSFFSYIQESGDASDLLVISTAAETVAREKYIGPKPPGMIVYGGNVKYPKQGSSKTFSLSPKDKGQKSEPPQKTEDARYLQANIVSDANKLVEGPLQPSQKFKMGVQIGLPKKGFQHADVEFPSNLIFPEEKELETTVDLKVKTNLDKETRFSTIKVPRWGDSQTAYFDFATDAMTPEFAADIQAFHKNRLIQEVRLTVKVSSNTEEKDAQNMKLVFCARKSLTNLEGRTAFTASIQVIAGGKEESTVQGISENKPLDLFFSGGLKKHLEQMRDKIEEALGAEYKEDELKKQQQDYEDLLLYLAMKGSLVYKDHLRGKVTPNGPLQIISNDQSFLPVDFIYSYPVPDVDAKLCTKSKDALKNGKCCGDVKENEAISKLVCPFGFWSCSRIIERHNYQKRSNNSNADYCVVSEPVENRETLQVLNNTLFGTSARVDRAGAGITQSMLDAIKKYKVKLSEASDWDKWTELVGKNSPDSLILVVHIEKDEKFEMNKLELGDQKFLLQTHIGAKVISREHLDPPPFVVMLGCESTEINNEGFDVASHLMNEGAAIVLSNFTRIKGNHARDIVINLVKFLEEEGKQVQRFGEIMLKLRRYLLSEGLLAGLILLAQGDADWKIKI